MSFAAAFAIQICTAAAAAAAAPERGGQEGSGGFPAPRGLHRARAAAQSDPKKAEQGWLWPCTAAERREGVAGLSDMI